MNYKNYLEDIKEIRSKCSSITETAKVFCQKYELEYSDTVRRSISNCLKENKKEIKNSSNTKWEENNTKETAYFEGNVSKPVKTLEEALKVSKADMKKWEVERWICNSWGVTSWKSGSAEYRTNYQVKVWFKKREVEFEQKLKDLIPIIEQYSPKNINKVKTPRNIGVISLTDFHIGAEIKNLLKTKDFNIQVLLDYISKAVEIINRKDYSEVHVNLLGDFFESLTGMNHENTFKSLGQDMWGANVIILANEIIGEHLLSKINNLKGVNIVSGNHDRMSASNTLDNTGEGGKVLWYMLTKDFPDLPIDYHNSVISKEIDGINYLLSHGDKGYSKKEFSKFVLDYGDNTLYNLVIEGHLHTRKTKRSMSLQRKYYQDIEVVSFDDSNYRKLTAPSIFTGNWYSESLGFGGNAGMLITENNGEGGVNVFDYTL